MDDISAKLSEMYSAYGKAAEMAQAMETEAGNLVIVYCTVVLNLDNRMKDEQHSFKSLIDDVNSRTLGNLIRHMRKSIDFDEGIEATLDNALKRRNHLVHNFFRFHNLAIFSEEGLSAMILELEETCEILRSAHTTLLGMTGAITKAFGRADISVEIAADLIQKSDRLEI